MIKDLHLYGIVLPLCLYSFGLSVYVVSLLLSAAAKNFRSLFNHPPK
jgi:hypothetical protein